MNTLDLEWKAWNDQGFIPGPQETEEEFKQRIFFCKNLLQELNARAGTDLPFTSDDDAPLEIRQEALTLSKKLYGISPGWVPIFFNNYQLTPWHGGCAWIFQLSEQTPTAAFLQLRAIFRKKKTYLGLYERSELIAHELAHVGRMVYAEPQFEEILAYRSSRSPFRQFFGPLVQSAKESLLFILLLGLILMANLALFAMNTPLTFTLALWLWTIPLSLVLFALLRLFRKQGLFKACLQNLKEIYQDKQLADHLIYRLTDKEISLFGKITSSEIRDYIQIQKTQSFRWDFLNNNYPFNK